MTVDRQHGRLIFSCDACDEVVEDTAAGRARDDFDRVWEMLKEEGWRAVKSPKGAWMHFCPKCKE